MHIPQGLQLNTSLSKASFGCQPDLHHRAINQWVSAILGKDMKAAISWWLGQCSEFTEQRVIKFGWEGSLGFQQPQAAWVMTLMSQTDWQEETVKSSWIFFLLTNAKASTSFVTDFPILPTYYTCLLKVNPTVLYRRVFSIQLQIQKIPYVFHAWDIKQYFICCCCLSVVLCYSLLFHYFLLFIPFNYESMLTAMRVSYLNLL